MKLSDEQKEEIEAEKFAFENLINRENLNADRGGRMILTDEIKEEIEASLWYSMSYAVDIKPSDLVRYIERIAAPAIFKILEKEELK